MQLTLYTDYSLRVLMYLVGTGDRLVPTAELAEFHDVSRNHLAKVIQGLADQGWVETVKGKYGGLRLAIAPEKLTIAKIVQATEPNFDLAECFSPGSGSCRIIKGCALKHVLARARQAFFSELQKVTLADICAKGRNVPPSSQSV